MGAPQWPDNSLSKWTALWGGGQTRDQIARAQELSATLFDGIN